MNTTITSENTTGYPLRSATKASQNATGMSLRGAAITAGVGLLLMTVMAPFALFYVQESLVIPGDAAATAQNIMANEMMFRLGGISYLIVAILDVLVAWALYIFLKPVNQGLSLLTAWLRVVYGAVYAFSVYNLFSALQMVSGAQYLSAFQPDQLYAQMMIYIEAFRTTWDIGLVIFGLHLALLGYLVFKSSYMPKFLGVLLIIAALGYLVDSFGKLLSPNYTLELAMFTFLGEVILIFWLLIKGARVQLPAQTDAS